MKPGRTINFVVFLIICALLSDCFAYENVNPRGPMAIRNQMPLYLFWYEFPQEKAQIAENKKFVTAFDYTVSNVVVDKATEPGEKYVVKTDMEINRYNLNVRYGIRDNMEVSAETSYLVLSKGYLDTFIPNFEHIIGAKAVGARRTTDKYQFNYNLQYNGKNLINTQSPTSGMGDTALSAKYMLLDEDESLPRVSVRGAVKLPTGSKTKFLGSGKCDYGLGLLFDKSFERFFTYANLSTVFINEPDFLGDIPTKNYIISGMLGLEYCFTERFSTVLQCTLHSTPYPKSGTTPLDNNAGEIALGLNYQFTVNSNWHIAVVENLFADSTPDVTFQVGGRIKI